jgi:hypothetical protein
MSGRRSPQRSNSRVANDHAPVTPSALRQSHTLSSSSLSNSSQVDDDDDYHWHSVNRPAAGTTSPPAQAGPSIVSTSALDPSETSSLLHHERAHPGPCDHGTFSPRPMSPAGSSDAEGASLLGSDTSTDRQASRGNWRKTLSSKMKSKTMTNSRALAEQHGFKDSRMMYLSYYVPFLIWVKQYNWRWLKGDFTAAVTLASMYLPMALSYADSLAHVPPINGLYAFVFNPFVYGLLGSCPQMIVGPEAAGSLLVGSIVKNSIELGHGDDDNVVMHAQVAGVAVGIAGATVFMMGLFRLGFLDSVLSRPFLRGFISAIGVVIFIDQMIPVLGLSAVAAETPGVGHGSSVQKLEFLFTHLGEVHKLSAIVGLVSFAVIMVLR